jgi:hypothetical protein
MLAAAGITLHVSGVGFGCVLLLPLRQADLILTLSETVGPRVFPTLKFGSCVTVGGVLMEPDLSIRSGLVYLLTKIQSSLSGHTMSCKSSMKQGYQALQSVSALRGRPSSSGTRRSVRSNPAARGSCSLAKAVNVICAMRPFPGRLSHDITLNGCAPDFFPVATSSVGVVSTHAEIEARHDELVGVLTDAARRWRDREIP